MEKPLDVYKKLLDVMDERDKVGHILRMTKKYGDKALAMFGLLFDGLNVFADEDGPRIVAARFIKELN